MILCGLLNRGSKTATQPAAVMTVAAAASGDGGTVTATAQELESGAHSAVLVDAIASPYSDVTDCGDFATANDHSVTDCEEFPIARSLTRRLRTRKRKSSTGLAHLDPVLAVGTMVCGSIEAKVESAYVISVVTGPGGEKLRGVLYQASPTERMTSHLGDIQSNIAQSPADSAVRRRRRRVRTKDRNAPKKNRSGYNYFFAKERARLKEVYPEVLGERTISQREISQTIADGWNSLSQKDREPYQLLGMKDKERYQREKSEYVGRSLYELKPLIDTLDGGQLLRMQGTGEAQEEDTKADGSMPIGEDGPAAEPWGMDLAMGKRNTALQFEAEQGIKSLIIE